MLRLLPVKGPTRFARKPPTLCNDNIDCTIDDCNPDQETCIHAPVDQLCDDGDTINGLESCNPNFGCQAGDPLSLIRVIPVIRQAPCAVLTVRS